MIILDTDVLSALIRDPPDQQAVEWLDESPSGLAVFTTAVNAFELLYGIERLAAGKRRTRLFVVAERMLREEFDQRVLPFDLAAGQEAARLKADRERRGINMDVRDTMIGAIALSRKATLATRNTRHFADLGVQLFDPWAA